jgi:hypothetical protein
MLGPIQVYAAGVTSNGATRSELPSHYNKQEWTRKMRIHFFSETKRTRRALALAVGPAAMINGKVDWSRKHLRLANPLDVAFAAESIADGRGVVHAFGNFTALSFHPDVEVMRSVNAAKGRPLDQVASVTTTRTHMFDLFDWDNLPEGLVRVRVMRMMNRFYKKGPFGFRGPAAEHVPSHLTTVVDGVRTVQVIAPGYHCSSNRFLEAALERSRKQFLGITSGNVSRHETGKEEPAHFKMKGAKEDLGSRGFVMLAHGRGRSFDEWKARRKLRAYSPISVSILGFYKQGTIGQPTVTIDRHGSLPDTKILEELRELGVATDGNRPDRIAQRTYHPRLRRAANYLV